MENIRSIHHRKAPPICNTPHYKAYYNFWTNDAFFFFLSFGIRTNVFFKVLSLLQYKSSSSFEIGWKSDNKHLFTLVWCHFCPTYLFFYLKLNPIRDMRGKKVLNCFSTIYRFLCVSLIPSPCSEWKGPDPNHQHLAEPGE